MRWTLGNYTLKYNPKTLNKSWSPQNQVNIGVNGLISNPNLLYQGTQTFSIEVYEKPTEATTSSLTGTYVGISEKRVNAQMYLLKLNGTFDVKNKDNSLVSTHTIVSGNGISLPTGTPTSINDWDSGLAFMYSNSSGNQLLITDENGIANRKYIYNSDDSRYIEDIAWDYNSNFVALNPYGQIYTINTSTGVETLAYQFGDYATNKSSSIKRYTSIFMYVKNESYYIGVLIDKKDILFIDYSTYDSVCKAYTGTNNLLAVSYSSYSGDSFALCGFTTSSKIEKLTYNTCRIDIEQIKSAVVNGQVSINDENGFPYMLGIRTLTVTRDPNGNEARYEVTIDGDLIYVGMGFGNTWIANNRII